MLTMHQGDWTILSTCIYLFQREWNLNLASKGLNFEFSSRLHFVIDMSARKFKKSSYSDIIKLSNWLANMIRDMIGRLLPRTKNYRAKQHIKGALGKCNIIHNFFQKMLRFLYH